MQTGVDAKTVQQHCGIGFRIPTVHFRKFRFQLAGTDSVFIGKIFFRINCIFFLHNLVQPFISHDNRVHDRIAVIFEMVLLQNGKTLSGRNGDIAVRRFQRAGQNLQKSRFSRAVCANQTIAVSFRKFDVYILKESLFADSVSYVICTNHI